MDPKVDLTEDGVFRQQTEKLEIIPVICWYGYSNDLDYLKNKIKLAHTRENEIVPKKTFNLEDTGLLNDSVTYTIRTHSNGGQTYYIDTTSLNRISSFTSYISSTSTNNWTVSYQTGTESTYTYTTANNYSTIHVKYNTNGYTKPSALEEVREELWGTSKLPEDEVPFYKKRAKDSIVWNLPRHINTKEERNPTDIFPWYPQHRYSFDLFVETLIRHWMDLKFHPTRASISFDDIIDAKRVHWDDHCYQDVDYPWDFDYEEEQPKKPETFTEYIYDVAPWMVDMLRDVWRNTISPDLVAEYFTYNWHNMTIPYYKQKWFESSDASNELKERGRTSHVTWLNSTFNSYLTSTNPSTQIFL